jgi:uncharacterized protein with HEPN domain
MSESAARERRFYLDDMIGEAASHIPEGVRAANSQLPWRLLIATRDRLIHGYLRIDNDSLWSIIQDDMPDSLPKLRQPKEPSA